MVYMQINGLVLGKYRIEKLINNGSFASVFRAKEEFTNRTVAIKVLPKSIYPTGRMRYLLTELSADGAELGTFQHRFHPYRRTRR